MFLWAAGLLAGLLSPMGKVAKLEYDVLAYYKEKSQNKKILSYPNI